MSTGNYTIIEEDANQYILYKIKSIEPYRTQNPLYENTATTKDAFYSKKNQWTSFPVIYIICIRHPHPIVEEKKETKPEKSLIQKYVSLFDKLSGIW